MGQFRQKRALRTDSLVFSLTRHSTLRSGAQRNAILAVLLLSTVGAWIYSRWQVSAMGMEMAGPTMGMDAAVFLSVWIVMMIAMMFPAAAPMIVTFHRVQQARLSFGRSLVGTFVFVAGYLLVWSLSGAIAYTGAVAFAALAARATLPASTISRAGGVIFLAAGLYQLSPLKNFCLARCRTPAGFIVMSWRDGIGGALRMGLVHGAFCLGCCWLLFLILFPLGIMNLAAMAAVTALIFAEKTFPFGERIALATGLLLALYGLFVLIAAPAPLPFGN